MPLEMLIAVLVEVGLILLATILLTQPSFVFSNRSARSQYLITIGGFVVLCLTFCWSFVLGCALVLRDMHGWL